MTYRAGNVTVPVKVEECVGNTFRVQVGRLLRFARVGERLGEDSVFEEWILREFLTHVGAEIVSHLHRSSDIRVRETLLTNVMV